MVALATVRARVRGTLGAEVASPAVVKPEGEALGPGGAACVAAVAGVCGSQGAGPAGGLCRDAGAGCAEGGGPPPGAAQCGGSFQPVSVRRVAAARRRAAESRALPA